jgi:hypothetical protein
MPPPTAMTVAMPMIVSMPVTVSVTTVGMAMTVSMPMSAMAMSSMTVATVAMTMSSNSGGWHRRSDRQHQRSDDSDDQGIFLQHLNSFNRVRYLLVPRLSINRVQCPRCRR